MSSGQASSAHGTDTAGQRPQVMVAADGVCRTFGGGHTAVRALRGVSFTIDRGQLVALRGRSGSGKTTLLNIIGGLDDPTEGRVWVDGSEVNRHAATDELGTTTLHAREYATLDRAGRVQLPREMVRRLAMRNRVELQEEPDHVGVWPDQSPDQKRD